MAPLALASRLLNLGGKKTGTVLGAELQRATESGPCSIPEGAVLAVVHASHDAAGRREIMLHLHGCLSETASSQWRRVYSGISVLDSLLERGPQELVSEVAGGDHFDLLQRLSFLERYEYGYDPRVQNLVRRKALSLRQAWHKRQLALAETADAGGQEISAPLPRRSAGIGSEPSSKDPQERPVRGCRQKEGQALAAACTCQDLLDGSTTGSESSTSPGASPGASPRPNLRCSAGTAARARAAPVPGLEALLGEAGGLEAQSTPAPAEPRPAVGGAGALPGVVDWLSVAREQGLCDPAPMRDLLAAEPAGTGHETATELQLLQF